MVAGQILYGPDKAICPEFPSAIGCITSHSIPQLDPFVSREDGERPMDFMCTQFRDKLIIEFNPLCLDKHMFIIHYQPFVSNIIYIHL